MEWMGVVACIISILCMIEVYELKKAIKDTAKEEQIQKTYAEILQAMKGSECEIILKDLLSFAGCAYSFKGKILDADDEWVLIGVVKGKKTVQRMFRISLISDVKELKA